MNYIRQEHLDFMQEAKQAFTDNARLETYRNTDDTFIALRQGQDRNCIEVFALTPGSLFFENIMDKAPKLIVQPTVELRPSRPTTLTYKGVKITGVPYVWDGHIWEVMDSVEKTCGRIYDYCINHDLKEFEYHMWLGDQA
jgi:hypothetical protein